MNFADLYVRYLWVRMRERLSFWQCVASDRARVAIGGNGRNYIFLLARRRITLGLNGFPLIGLLKI
jgi:hypothetical protein